MNTPVTLNRRDFVVSLLGGALVVGTFDPAAAATVDADPWTKAPAKGAREFTPWLTIAPDGTVTVKVLSPEIGNGVMTQILAYVHEELQPKWEDVRAEHASVNRNYRENGVYGNAETGAYLAFFGGRSTAAHRMKTYMTAAATAREQLKAAAAQAWGVPAGEIKVAEGVLSHANGRSAPFAQMLAPAAAIKLKDTPQPKPRDQWVFLGKTTPAKVHIPQIVDGTAVYGIDVRVPGMVYAALRQSPVMGGSVKSFNASAVEKMPGVLAVVEIKAGEPGEATTVKFPYSGGLTTRSAAVAVIAEHYWQAKTALDALPVEWSDGPGAKWRTTEMMTAAVMDALDQPGEAVEARGDVAAEFAKKGTIVEAKYHTPYCDHMVMEPLNGTAMVTAERAEVWHPTQNTEMTFATASAESGAPQENVHIYQPFVGGGFGRRVYTDDVRMVVAVAKAFPGRPVHTIWSREETTRQGRYRAMMGASMKARLGDDGLPTAILVRVAGGPGFSTTGMVDGALLQVVPNVEVEGHTLRDFHIKSGPYRGPGFNSNVFFVESFIDECAVAAKADPMDYRIALYDKYNDAGWAKCLRELKAKSDWGAPLPAGQGRGVAVGCWGSRRGQAPMGTTCAAVVHLEVSAAGALKIHRIDVAFDSGRIVNRDAVLAELEGGTIFGLNMAMNEALNIRGGRIVEGNYDEYPMLRIADIPEIRVHFGGLTDADRYGEIGEPPVGPIGAAVANAIFQATGKRLRAQPFRKHDLRANTRTA